MVDVLEIVRAVLGESARLSAADAEALTLEIGMRLYGCRCFTYPKHRRMADGHRPDCMSRPPVPR